jgi:hypothetical protein
MYEKWASQIAIALAYNKITLVNHEVLIGRGNGLSFAFQGDNGKWYQCYYNPDPSGDDLELAESNPDEWLASMLHACRWSEWDWTEADDYRMPY